VGEQKRREEAGTYPEAESIKVMHRIMEDQFHAFKAHFGREPYGEDPVWFDPAFNHPVPLDNDKIEEIVKAKFVELTKDTPLVVAPDGL
jgi:hypothetical protein